jgi:hypothetical protein
MNKHFSHPVILLTQQMTEKNIDRKQILQAQQKS